MNVSESAIAGISSHEADSFLGDNDGCAVKVR